MATVNLGRIKFVWQGAYNGATAYVADDVVSYNGSSYICILASTGNLPTNATYWSLMAQSGTDITSIAGLAQGDVLYYNGTSWVRLGAGTSGQYLKTNGTGANPSWSTVSSDFVKLAETTASNVSSVSLNGYFTSDYDVYKIFIDGVYGSSSAYAAITFNTTGSYTEQTSSYNYVFGSYRNIPSDADGGVYTSNDGASLIHYLYADTSEIRAGSANLTLFNPMSTSYYKLITGNSVFRNNDYIGITGFSGSWDSTTAITGIRFKMSTGNIYARKIRLYGVKN